MRTGIIILIIALISQQLSGQIISGKLSDKKGGPLPGANIFIEGSYDGTSTDEDGAFLFTSNLQGEQILVIRYIGFRENRRQINLAENNTGLEIILKESSNNLNAVVITAGAFEASDEKKGVVLKPLDILTTAGGLGDISGAINTLPGTQMVGEEGKIFVRGGDSYETKTYFDGLQVEQPYYSALPDIPTRGRFSPWLFSGTVFSSGGYSAEYGQALSSALILKSEGLAEEDVTSLSLMSVGLGASHTKRWENTSLSLSGGYTNLHPYFALIDQKYEWELAPMGYEGNIIFRQKVGKEGLLKAYGSYSYGRSKLQYPDYKDPRSLMDIDLKENNSYFNTTWSDRVGENWISKGGLSYSDDRSAYVLGEDLLDELIKSTRLKYKLTHINNEFYKIHVGAEYNHKDYRQDFAPDSSQQVFGTYFMDNLSAAYAESELTLGPGFAARLGGRFEYSSHLNRISLAPRLSLALRTGKESQVSLAWGHYYQNPRDEFLRFTSALDFEKATHYILNYQLMKNKRIFRIEAYYKDYNRLVKYNSLNSSDPANYNNNGEGYARGIDIFWRDESIDFLDYWISYAYIDTKRDYLNYPLKAVPDFVSTHNLRAVAKYYIGAINTQAGFTYSFASGRSYFNPNNESFMADRTKAYHDLSFNFSYLTSLWNNFTIVYFSVGNLLDREHVFGYNYSPQPNEQGNFEAFAIEPMAKRFIFLGVFISLAE